MLLDLVHQTVFNSCQKHPSLPNDIICKYRQPNHQPSTKLLCSQCWAENMVGLVPNHQQFEPYAVKLCPSSLNFFLDYHQILLKQLNKWSQEIQSHGYYSIFQIQPTTNIILNGQTPDYVTLISKNIVLDSIQQYLLTTEGNTNFVYANKKRLMIEFIDFHKDLHNIIFGSCLESFNCITEKVKDKLQLNQILKQNNMTFENIVIKKQAVEYIQKIRVSLREKVRNEIILINDNLLNSLNEQNKHENESNLFSMQELEDIEKSLGIHKESLKGQVHKSISELPSKADINNISSNGHEQPNNSWFLIQIEGLKARNKELEEAFSKQAMQQLQLQNFNKELLQKLARAQQENILLKEQINKKTQFNPDQMLLAEVVELESENQSKSSDLHLLLNLVNELSFRYNIQEAQIKDKLKLLRNVEFKFKH